MSTMSNRKTKPTNQPTQTPPNDVATVVDYNAQLLQAELETLRQGWQRTQADFDNFRRRTVTEQHERTALLVGQALQALIPIAENLRRAVGEFEKLNRETGTVDALRSWAGGVTAIARQFDQALANAGLTPIDPTPGEPFNPHEHEALSHQPHPVHSSDTVVQVVERGYKVNANVVAPAKVIVSAGPSALTSKE